jgi:hypothetical protein
MDFSIALFLQPYPDAPLSSMCLNTSLTNMPPIFCCMNHRHKSYVQLERALKLVCFSRHDSHFETFSYVSDYETNNVSETGNISVFRSKLRIGIVGGHLSTRYWTFRFHKMQGISWLTEDQLPSQEGLWGMKERGGRSKGEKDVL